MTLVNIDLRNAGYETGPDDRVIFYSLLVREGEFGTISTAPVEVELEDGQGTVDLAPGPVGVQIIAGQVADTRVKIGEVPSSGPTTLNAVMMVTPAYTPALQKMMITAIERAKEIAVGQVDAEVAQAVDAEVGEFKTKAEQALTKSTAAESKSDAALSRSTTAETSAGNAVSRVSALEAMSGLSPESPVDGQTANLVSQPGTLTRQALVRELDKRTVLFEATPGSDITESLNAAISGGGHIKIQPGTFWVDPAVGISIPSGTDLEFSPGTVLKVTPTSLANHALLKLRDVRDVRIINPVLVGERYQHIGTTGEWGMGIDMRGTTNVEIINPHCSDFWGDGIYIGTTSTQQWCEDTRIINPVCDGNQRQGISVISVKGLLLESPFMKNTAGKNPQAGIDIEPNYPTDHLENIRITNMRSENNAGGGLAFILGQMANGGRVVDITVDGIHAVDNSAFRAAGTDGVLDGSITVRNVVAIRGGIQIRNYSTRFPHIYADNVAIINPNESGSTSAKYGSGVAVIADTGDTNSGPIGNVTFTNLEVVDNQPVKKVMDAVYVWDASGNSIPIKNVNIIDPRRLDFTNRVVTFFGAGRTSDANGVLSYGLASVDRTVSHGSSAIKLYHNAPATALRRVTVSESLSDGYPSFIVEVRAPYPLRVIPTGQIIHTMTSEPGRYIQSSEVGARIELEKRDGALWVKSILGKWTAEPEPDPIIPE